MVAILVGPQSLVELPKGQSLALYFFCCMLMISHCLWTAPFCSLLMMQKSFNPLEVKVTIYNYKWILIYCTIGLKPGYLALILVSAMFCTWAVPTLMGIITVYGWQCYSIY